MSVDTASVTDVSQQVEYRALIASFTSHMTDLVGDTTDALYHLVSFRTLEEQLQQVTIMRVIQAHRCASGSVIHNIPRGADIMHSLYIPLSASIVRRVTLSIACGNGMYEVIAAWDASPDFYYPIMIDAPYPHLLNAFYGLSVTIYTHSNNRLNHPLKIGIMESLIDTPGRRALDGCRIGQPLHFHGTDWTIHDNNVPGEPRYAFYNTHTGEKREMSPTIKTPPVIIP